MFSVLKGYGINQWSTRNLPIFQVKNSVTFSLSFFGLPSASTSVIWVHDKFSLNLRYAMQWQYRNNKYLQSHTPTSTCLRTDSRYCTRTGPYTISSTVHEMNFKYRGTTLVTFLHGSIRSVYRQNRGLIYICSSLTPEQNQVRIQKRKHDGVSVFNFRLKNLIKA